MGQFNPKRHRLYKILKDVDEEWAKEQILILRAIEQPHPLFLEEIIIETA